MTSPTPPSGDDPTTRNFLRPFTELTDAVDADIAALYAERHVQGLRPRFAKVLIRLSRLGPLTVRQLAAEVGVTHSAMSQTVAELRRSGYVDSAPGSDARTRVITLTDAGAAAVPLLEREWNATEDLLAELDAAVPYSFQQVVADLRALLEQRSFLDRLRERLADETDPR
ncbi:MarR family winged helix-turn-helix transcriptional regulator [Quadrisphaera oryzae]|uniref:MarR family winged helix-turn-helix transcriptional regulator n=1 Tax=Quadrisphaera TaxID=317661 RepID=UPI0016454B56|nr:MarR family transcriptional regulator [Quadrisphaera sp. RL12-1S]